MKYLIIGSGGREHALSWRLLNDGSASEVYVAPGNGGIEERFRVRIDVNDFESVAAFCRSKNIGMVVIGPEAPLVAGLADYLTGRGINAFGPSAAAARLEGSKLFAKSIMEKYGVPTARHFDFTGPEEMSEYIRQEKNFPIVIKLDGLAAGKGVAIPENAEEALDFVRENVKSGARAFVEEFIDGEEASILGISDGEDVISLVSAQDHKRIFDGDRGPNTGGMGAYAPAPVMTASGMEEVNSRVMKPVIAGMKNEGVPFKGILYAGIIAGRDGIKVLEFNVRFGDPETQALLPLLEGRLGDYFASSVRGGIGNMGISFKKKHAITVVMSSGGYPGPYAKGHEISGLDRIKDAIVFHAGTEIVNGRCVTAGGRVLNVTALGDSLEEARGRVYGEIEKISFEGAFYRKDIAHRALGK